MTKQELENNEPLSVKEALEMAFEAGRNMEDQYWECYGVAEFVVIQSLLRRVEAGSGKAEAKAEGLVVCDHAKECGFGCKDHHKPHTPTPICTRESECVHIHKMVKCVPVEPKP